MKDEIITILKENNIISQGKYWAYPDDLSLYNYSQENVGIKIHLSATVINCETILNRFLKWNKKYQIGFKVCKSLKVLEEINQGLYGYSQTGKFITLYPIQNTRYLNKILTSLYKLFNDLSSVDIPSDISFLNSSVVYIRYGEFKKGQKQFVDKREGYIPSVAKSKIFALNLKKYYVVPNNLKILKLIKKSSKGGVYLAWNDSVKKMVLLKEATKNAQMTLTGNDSVLSLYKEIQLLKKMSYDDYNFVPNYMNAFWLENSLFLEESYITGNTLDNIIQNDLRERRCVLKNFRNLLVIIHKLHKLNNYVIHDLSPSNIIFSNDQFYLIDFEAMSKANEKLSTVYGTRGFIDSNYNYNDETVDYFALAKIYYYLNHENEYKKLTTSGSEVSIVSTKNNLWLNKCVKHLYKNDKEFLMDYDKYVGTKNEISEN